MNILLVEDDPGIGRFVRRGLEAEGYGVQWLRTGGKAAAALADGGYAAMILDLGLPDGDGLDLCRDLRAQGIDTPVCMLTARAGLDDKLDGFRCGTDDYMAKPFAFEELLARVAALVRRHERPGQVSLGSLSLDPMARTAAYGGVPVELRPREFDVLLLLLRRAGQVVSREEILDIAWRGAEITDNAVDVYVGYLRRRLDGHAGAPRIETVRGRGYCLCRPPNDRRAPTHTALGAPGA